MRLELYLQHYNFITSNQVICITRNYQREYELIGQYEGELIHIDSKERRKYEYHLNNKLVNRLDHSPSLIK